MKTLTELKSTLSFVCAHERFPEGSAGADGVFKFARWLQINNQLNQDRSVDAEVERLFRIAGENGSAKAIVNLQSGAVHGQFSLDGPEQLRLPQKLIDAGVATGYLLVGLFLQEGGGGLDSDEEMALGYFRKAANEGNPQAQAYVADLLAPKEVAPNVARQMRRCAAEQGSAEAAKALAINLSVCGQYSEALEAFQLGVAAGNSTSASFLSKGFSGPAVDDRIYYLGQHADLVRAERYKKIWRVLSDYSYADPKVPEINEIVPLPPAELPQWDGKLKWVEARLANIPPPKPSEELLLRLANAKQLDPTTGKPLPSSPDFTQANFPQQICYPGQACPRAGHWKVIWPSLRNVRPKEVIRHFNEGEIFPLQTVERYHLRPWPLRDKTTFREEAVEWGLIG